MHILKCNRIGIGLEPCSLAWSLIASSGDTAAELCRRSALLANVRWEQNSKRFVFLSQLIYRQFIKA